MAQPGDRDDAPFELDPTLTPRQPAPGGGSGPVIVCPECREPLAAGAMLCTACGLNLMTMSKVAAGSVSTEAIDPEVAAKTTREKAEARAQREKQRAAEREEESRLAKEEAAKALSAPGGLPRVVLLVLGAVLLMMAVGLGAYNLAPTAELTHRLARGAAIVLGCLLHIGTGLGALWIVAQVQGRPLGRIDLAVERLFVAVAAFLCVFNLSIPIPFVGVVLKVLLAIGTYWGSVYLLMGRNPQRTTAISLAHAVIAALVYLQMSLWAFAHELVVR